MNANRDQSRVVGMQWGIKRSFIGYLSRVPDSRSSVTDGAALLDNGEYHYELADDVIQANGRHLQFRGSVRFTAHHGQLRLGLTDPLVRVDESAVTVSVVDHFGLNGARGDAFCGTLSEQSGNASRTITAVRLTDWGAREIFAGMYEAGEVFDDIIVAYVT